MQEKRTKVHKKLQLKGKFEAEYNEFLQQLGAIIKARRIELKITQEDLDSLTKQTSRLSGVNAFQAAGDRAREESRHRS